jgi:hypothetical protein
MVTESFPIGGGPLRRIFMVLRDPDTQERLF